MPTPQEPTAQAGAKRKRTATTKFYAVRTGYKPGIYHSWDDCLQQVKGFKGAIFKSFTTLTEAERYVEGDGAGAANNSTSSNPRFYAVKSGRAPGIYTDWPSAQKQITGWTKPIYKGFASKAEAQRFVDGGSTDVAEQSQTSETTSLPAGLGQESPAKKQKGPGSNAGVVSQKPTRKISEDTILDGYEPGVQLPIGAEDGFDTNIILKKGSGDVVFKSDGQRRATKLRSSGLATSSPLRIYTDGSSLRNGQAGAFAGVGVYFGPLDPRNVSESLPGPRQTNQRAELTAIVRALDTAPKDRDIVIITDSQYAINCATKWYDKWKDQKWKTSSGKNVENRDVVENIVNKIEERTTLQSKTDFEWIKGHANHEGNVEADKLAVEGARNAAAKTAVEGAAQISAEES